MWRSRRSKRVRLRRAFETGYLSITAERTVVVDYDWLQEDSVLYEMLNQFNGVQLVSPVAAPPHPDYLERRIASSTKTLGHA